MFTGIVEELGTVSDLQELGDAIRLTVHAPGLLGSAPASEGESICVNGVCLTVAQRAEGGFVADVMRETLRRSALGQLAPGSRVNVERALQPTARLGGHIVQGHVDATARLLRRAPSEHWQVLRFSLPPQLARYVVEKGSIAVSGTSLTVSALGEDWFEVSLIPTTLRDTILGELEVGGEVNLEVDVVAKYVERLCGTREQA